MKTYEFLLVMVFLIFVSFSATAEEDIIGGYFDFDNKIDKMILKTNQNSINVCIELADKEKSSPCFNVSTGFGVENTSLYSVNKGELILHGSCCGREKSSELYFYKYISNINDWILYKEIMSNYYGPEINPEKQQIEIFAEEIKIKYDVGNKTISGKVIDASLFDRVQYKNELKRRLQTIHDNQLHKFRKKEVLTIEIGILDLYEYLSIVPISLKNIELYNNIAFFLQEKKYYSSAAYLLEKITKNYPNRIVAYLNLGDAYFSLDEENIAKKSYKKYVKLMKKAGKQKRIPKRVYDRLK